MIVPSHGFFKEEIVIFIKKLALLYKAGNSIVETGVKNTTLRPLINKI